MRVYINKTENRITFVINAEYYIGLLMPKRMILFESNKSKITNVDNNDCQQDSRTLYTIVLNKPVNY